MHVSSKGWYGVLFMRQQFTSARDVAILFIVSPRQIYELNAIFIYSCIDIIHYNAFEILLHSLYNTRILVLGPCTVNSAV